MIDSKYRALYDKVLIAPICNTIRIHPNYLTLLGLLLGLAILPLEAYGHSYIAATCLLLSGYFDTLDGSVARQHKSVGNIGTVLDITSDRLVEWAVIFGLYLYDPSGRGLLSLLMLGSILFCVTSFLVVSMFLPNTSEKSFHYSPGLVERGEAFLFFLAMLLFPSVFFWLSVAFSALVFLTGILRIVEFACSEITSDTTNRKSR